ncbi:MAG: hypothetical protein Q7S54_00715 [bacterium]|nr:hypothetical protein [bacterium]
MTPRELFVELERKKGRRIALLRVLFLNGLASDVVDEEIADDDDAENFYFITIAIMQDFWENLLFATSARLVDMEGFSTKEVLREVNCTILLLRDFLNEEFETDLPEQKLAIPNVH